jgi:hypothetical protein
MLIPFDFFDIIVGDVLTLLAALLINLSDFAFAFGGITKEGLPSSALIASDHEIPLEWFAVG